MCKVRKSNLVTYLNQRPLFEWCVVRCGPRNGHQKGMCLEVEIGVNAEILPIILGSRVKMFGGT